MRDVAALAGVGLKTVSRVVNGDRESLERVRRASAPLFVAVAFALAVAAMVDLRFLVLGHS